MPNLKYKVFTKGYHSVTTHVLYHFCDMTINFYYPTLDLFCYSFTQLLLTQNCVYPTLFSSVPPPGVGGRGKKKCSDITNLLKYVQFFSNIFVNLSKSFLQLSPFKKLCKFFCWITYFCPTRVSLKLLKFPNKTAILQRHWGVLHPPSPRSYAPSYKYYLKHE